MKLFKKFMALLLTSCLAITTMSPIVSFANETPNSISLSEETGASDIYAENFSESIIIDGITYVYNYYYTNNNRTISVTNEATGQVDIILYDISSGKTYLNNQLFMEKVTDSAGITPYAYYEWEQVGSASSYKITWIDSVGVSTLAAIIAEAISNKVPAASFIATMGASAISDLAHSANGATITLSIQMYLALFVAPQYRYVVSIKSNSGKLYGPYYFQYFA